MADADSSEDVGGLPPVLKISPTELNFPPPLNKVITNILQLQNTCDENVAYKVKTTAPKRYCVRPNTGIISPKEKIEIQILLNFVKDPPKSLKSKDKFQIQSMIVKNASQYTSAEAQKELWENAPREQVMKQKLRCYFKPVNDPNKKKDDTNGTLEGTDSISGTNIDKFQSAILGDLPIQPVAKETPTKDKSSTAPSQSPVKESSNKNTQQSSATTTASATSTSNNKQDNNSDLIKQQLDEIEKLKKKIQSLEEEPSGGLKRRNVPSQSTPSTSPSLTKSSGSIDKSSTKYFGLSIMMWMFVLFTFLLGVFFGMFLSR